MTIFQPLMLYMLRLTNSLTMFLAILQDERNIFPLSGNSWGISGKRFPFTN